MRARSGHRRGRAVALEHDVAEAMFVDAVEVRYERSNLASPFGMTGWYAGVSKGQELRQSQTYGGSPIRILWSSALARANSWAGAVVVSPNTTMARK